MTEPIPSCAWLSAMALWLLRTSLDCSSSTSTNFSGISFSISSSTVDFVDICENGTNPQRPSNTTTTPPLFAPTTMCTLEKRGSLFILTLTGNDDHRLNPNLLDSIIAALRRVRSESSTTPSSALITTAHGKFFSNGYDLRWAKNSGSADDLKARLQLMSSKFRSLVADLISLPMPTIAAVSGHASAGGFILALSHDYVLMRRDRGFLYMSEMDIGFKVPAWFVKLLEFKIGSPAARRDIVMRATRFTADAAAEKGVIDSAHDSSVETMRAAVRLGEELVGRKWDGHVYGQNRLVLFADVLSALGYDDTVQQERHLDNGISRL